MGFKTKRQIQGRKVWQARVSKQKELQIKAGLLSVGQADPLPESTTVHNLTGPLLEVLKEESVPLVPPVTRQPLSEVLLVIEEPKPEPTNPTGADPIPEVSLFCSLCLRPCASDQVVEFSTEPSWNCLDVASGRDKLALLLGVEMELEQCAVCRSCWTMVETFVDFREGCLKASAWRERYPFGLDGAGDDWLSKENLEVMARTRKVVQEHVERIENARNRHELISDEIPEEKPMLADNQHSEEDVNYLLLPEEPPNDNSYTRTAEILDQTFSCEKCQRKFETEFGMKLHLRRCSRSSKTKSFAEKLYTCSICSVNFTKSTRLREHQNKHMGIKPYECRRENCNNRFHSTLDRFNHEKLCEGKKSLNLASDPSVERESSASNILDQLEIYSCSKCPKKFDSKDGLGNHTVKCDAAEKRQIPPLGIKPFKCRNESCGKHFYDSSELQRHTKLCGKKQSSKTKLMAHVKIHTCNDCGKAYKTAHSLNGHRRSVHTQEKAFICALCGQALEYGCLVPHMKKFHPTED
uniref:Zinc finger protein 235 n=1 Tax=Culex pipiens TaxID=7175 RepID=A0A8D8IMM8_CULPI